MQNWFSKRNIATFFLILMCMQYELIEGIGNEVSYLKFGMMCLSPFILLIASPKISKAVYWGILYILLSFFSALLHYETFRLSTVGYLISFIMAFILYYNLVYCEKVFTIDYFYKIIKYLIVAYIICLILQQIAITVGIHKLYIINLICFLDRGIGAQSLSLEPSHSATILTFLFLAFLRIFEIKWGKESVTIIRIFKQEKWVLIGFVWSMLTMGSGTAIIGLGILSLYFIRRRVIIIAIPTLLIFYIAIPYINFKPLQRAKVTLDAVLTLDIKNVKKADHSAAYRVVPLLNTITELDLTKAETWIGKGVDTTKNTKYLSKGQMLTGITDYGLICYIVALTFISVCCFTRFLSFEMLIFIAMLSCDIRSIYLIWGGFMVFTTIKYFQNNAILINYEKNNACFRDTPGSNKNGSAC